MSEISLRQIKEEERSDKIAKFFSKNKIIIKKLLTLTLAIAFFTIVFKIIQSNLEDKYSSLLHQSLIEEELGNFSESKEKLRQVYSARFAPKGIKSLASLRYASLLLIEGRKEKALDIYNKVAFTSLNDDFIQETAGLLASKILVGDIKESSSDKFKQETAEKLNKIVKNNKILKSYTLEQLAIFYIKTNEKQKARKTLEEIIHDQKISQSLKKRAQDLIKLI